MALEGGMVFEREKRLGNRETESKRERGREHVCMCVWYAHKRTHVGRGACVYVWAIPEAII